MTKLVCLSILGLSVTLVDISPEKFSNKPVLEIVVLNTLQLRDKGIPPHDKTS